MSRGCSQLPPAAIDPTAAAATTVDPAAPTVDPPAAAVDPAAPAVRPPATTAVDPTPTTNEPSRRSRGTGDQYSQGHSTNHRLRPFLETLEEIPSVKQFGLFCSICPLLPLVILFHAVTSPAL